jgi:hypothetical protein
VFVSHTSELVGYPAAKSFVAAARDGVRRAGGLAVDMADFGPDGRVPAEVCRAKVLSCDVFLAVIGFRYGSAVPGGGGDLSYTEFEFDVAGGAGKQRLVFLLDERAPTVPPALVDGDRSRIDGFRRRLQREVTAEMVSDPGALEAAVSQALVSQTLPGLAGTGAPRATSEGRPWMVPAPSGPVTDRPDLTGRLLESLLAPGADPVTLTTTLEGTGGFGKTTLAADVCRRPEVRRRFPGGILWVTVGEDARDAGLAAQVGGLCEVLTGQPTTIGDQMLAGGRLGRLLDARESMLLVVDDVWRADQLSPFLIGGTSCRRLVTTRNHGVAPWGGRSLLVDQMKGREAVETLSVGVGGLPAGLVGRMVKATGRWPVLLALVNAALADQVQAGATAEQAAVWVLRRLGEAGPTAFDVDVDDEGSRNRAVAATVAASLDRLTPDQRDRYLDLAVFPEDVDVPAEVLGLLWSATGGLDPTATDRLRRRMVRLRLVIDRWAGRAPAVRQHDVLRTYLRYRLGAGPVGSRSKALAEAARRLLPPAGAGAEEGQPARPEWWLLPTDGDVDYLWQHLPYHLAAAGMAGELADLCCDLRWVEATTLRFGSSVPAEAHLAGVDTPTGRVLRLALGCAAHVLGPVDPPAALGATLASRLGDVPGLEQVVAAYRAGLPRPRLDTVWPLPDQPDPALHRMFHGHVGAGLACAFSPDGTLLATAGDHGARLWDVATGREHALLTGDAGAVRACAFSPDGTLLATAGDHGARLWDVATGRELMAGPAGAFHGCAFSPDGSMLAAVGDRGATLTGVAPGSETERIPTAGASRRISGARSPRAVFSPPPTKTGPCGCVTSPRVRSPGGGG